MLKGLGATVTPLLAAFDPDGAVGLALSDADEPEAEDLGDREADERMNLRQRLPGEQAGVDLGDEREDLLVSPRVGPVDGGSAGRATARAQAVRARGG